MITPRHTSHLFSWKSNGRHGVPSPFITDRLSPSGANSGANCHLRHGNFGGNLTPKADPPRRLAGRERAPSPNAPSPSALGRCCHSPPTSHPSPLLTGTLVTSSRLTRRLDRRPHPLPVARPNAKAPRSPGKRSGASSHGLVDLSCRY